MITRYIRLKIHTKYLLIESRNFTTGKYARESIGDRSTGDRSTGEVQVNGNITCIFRRISTTGGK